MRCHDGYVPAGGVARGIRTGVAVLPENGRTSNRLILAEFPRIRVFREKTRIISPKIHMFFPCMWWRIGYYIRVLMKATHATRSPRQHEKENQMNATHRNFSSKSQAHAAYNLMRKRGFTVSQPWQDPNGTWRVTHLHK